MNRQLITDVLGRYFDADTAREVAADVCGVLFDASVVRSPAHLRALPCLTLVKDGFGFTWERGASGWIRGNRRVGPGEVVFPVRVLWCPEEFVWPVVELVLA